MFFFPKALVATLAAFHVYIRLKKKSWCTSGGCGVAKSGAWDLWQEVSNSCGMPGGCWPGGGQKFLRSTMIEAADIVCCHPLACTSTQYDTDTFFLGTSQ